MNLPSIRRPARAALEMLIAACAAMPALACELDGLSHGYGPMSALFAGAHRYQSLNGLEDEEAPPETPPAPAATVDAPNEAAARPNAPADSASTNEGTPSAPPAPRPSFVAWAKAKPKPATDVGGGEAPATWTRVSAPTADAPADTAPEAPAASERSN